jgi:phage-related protein (TIGR01555 family)
MRKQGQKGRIGNPEWHKGMASPNPTGRRRVPRTDSWTSAMTALGKMGVDKRLGDRFQADIVTREQALELWRGNDLAAKIIEKFPDEALRPGFQISIGGDDGGDLKGEIEEDWKNLQLRDRLWWAYAWMRGFGGGSILLGADDGSKDWSLPLNEENIRSFKWITALEPDDHTPLDLYDNPQESKFGEVKTYSLIGSKGKNVVVHESRLITFMGVQVSKRQRGSSATGGWGDSVLTRVLRVLNDHDMTWASVALLMRDFSQAVMKMKGLAELILKNKDDVILRRMLAIQLARSTAGAILMDSEEDFERKQTPMSGVDGVLDRFMTRMSAAGDMPVTFLYGVSPAGLNATGESDRVSFYDRIKVIEDLDFLPAIERVSRIQFLARGGEPDEWSVSFNPLLQQSEDAKATTRKTNAETDKIYIDMGVLTPSVVARSRFGGDEYSPDTHLNQEDIDLIEEEENSPDPAPTIMQPEDEPKDDPPDGTEQTLQ